MPAKLQDRGGKALIGLASSGAAFGVKKALTAAWQATTGKEPPKEGEENPPPLGEAIVWAVVVGACVAVARLLAGRAVIRMVGSGRVAD